MRVLVVEDERKIAAYVKRGLEEQGYAVDAAFTGGEALDWAEAVNFDLIVLDIMLPEMDGIAVCRELRQRGYRTPILMLTARDTIDDRVLGLDAGADDYLVKPFAFKELLARLRALTRRAADAPKSPVLQLADLTLDTLTRRVKRGGRLELRCVQPVEHRGRLHPQSTAQDRRPLCSQADSYRARRRVSAIHGRRR
jgi:DNA-binding response OmpR family regulator